MIENFKGTFEGKTKTSTILEVVDGSISCNSMNNSGLLAAAIKFVKGEPRIRFMNIRAFMPCSSGFLDAIVHFTGESAESLNCDNDVIFGAVDRVISCNANWQLTEWSLIQNCIARALRGQAVDG